MIYLLTHLQKKIEAQARLYLFVLNTDVYSFSFFSIKQYLYFIFYYSPVK